MRKQHFWWTFLVGGVVCTVYGASTLIYHYQHSNKLSVHSLVLLILGVIALVFYLVLYVLTLIQNRKKQSEIPATPMVDEEKVEEIKQEIVEPKKEEYKPRDDVVYEPRKVSRSRYDSDDSSSGYIKKVGYGPILEIMGNRIRDMRNNTYYRIEGNYIYSDGGGLSYEIVGDKIKTISGNYLYEISGNSINKVFGGYFASISGGYITSYDGSEKYEMSSSLNRKMLLIVSAILFGSY